MTNSITRNEFLKRAALGTLTLASGGSLLSVLIHYSNRDNHPSIPWRIESEKGDVYAVSEEGGAFRDLVFSFSEEQKDEVRQIIMESYGGRNISLSEKLEDGRRVNINQLLDRYLPRIREKLKFQYEYAQGRDRRNNIESKLTEKDLWDVWNMMAINCYGTALYVTGVLEKEEGIESEQLFSDTTKVSDSLIFKSKTLTPIEHPKFGDLVVLTVKVNEGVWSPIHMGVFLLPYRNKDGFIFNKLNPNEDYQVNTVSSYYARIPDSVQTLTLYYRIK